MEYKASLDTLCKGITAAAFIIFIIAGIYPVKMILSAQSNMQNVLIYYGMILFYVALLVFCYLYAPQSYTLSNDALIINRPAKNKSIKTADIAEVRTIDSSDLSGTIRTFGDGGLFGYYGKFYNSKIGSMTWYVTQRKNRILIKTKSGKKIIISPDDISLLNELQVKQGK